MSSVPSRFDPQALLEAAGGDATLARELIDIYLRIGPPMVARLRLAAAADTGDAIAEEAHALRGCLLLLGAVEAGADCRALEGAARRERGPVGARALALCDALDRLGAQVRLYRTDTSAPDGAGS